MSLANGDLTCPANVALWLPNSGSANEQLIQQLITRMSALIRTHLSRPTLLSKPYSRYFDGTGTGYVVLPEWPVTQVTRVQLGSVVLPQSPAPPPLPNGVPFTQGRWGWKFAPWAGNLPGDPAILEFNGGQYCRGRLNLQVNYRAGYLIENEADSVGGSAGPSPYSVTVQQPSGICAADAGVSYANGAVLTAVAADPQFGQYVPPGDAAPGLYQFSAADGGMAVLISYSFVPADLEEACIQLVAERYSYRTRVGDQSKSLGGQETMSYLRKGLPPEVEAMLCPYISVLPPAIGGAL